MKSLPSDLVRRQIPSDAVPKSCPKSRAKNIPKSVGAMMHPCLTPLRAMTHLCLTPLRVSKCLEEMPLSGTVPFMFEWKDSVILCNFGGQPVWRSWKRPSLLTRSNAFARAMKTIYSGICCSPHFSWSWRREKTMSVGSSTVIQDRHVLPAYAVGSR